MVLWFGGDVCVVILDGMEVLKEWSRVRLLIGGWEESRGVFFFFFETRVGFLT